MKKSEILASVRRIADELSVRGPQAGKIGVGTKHRIGELFNPPRPLMSWLNSERELTESGQSIPTKRGEVLVAIVGHLMSAYGGGQRLTSEEREQAITIAACALPDLCNRLDTSPPRTPPISTESESVPANERMIQALNDDARRKDWKAKDWASFLRCTVDHVYDLPFWKALRGAQEEDRKRRGKRIREI